MAEMEGKGMFYKTVIFLNILHICDQKFWIEGWGIEKLTMIDLQNCQFKLNQKVDQMHLPVDKAN